MIDRFRTFDQLSPSGQVIKEISDVEKLAIRRALFFALDDYLDDFFQNAIEEIRKKTLVNRDFTKRLFRFSTQKYLIEIREDQTKILSRYFESLVRQQVIPQEVYNFFRDQIVDPY